MADTPSIGSGKHACPKDGCEVMVGRNILACRTHWYQVTPETRRRVNSTWRSSDIGAYLAAREAAVAEMNSR